MSIDLPALPYERMPVERFGPIHTALIQRNFPPNSIKSNYAFTYKKESLLELNCVAFADTMRWDTDTSSVAVYYDPKEKVQDSLALEKIAVSGAPVALIGKANTVSLFKITANGQPKSTLVRSEIPYEEIPSVFEQYARDINPTRIFDVKHGLARFETHDFADIVPLQLRLWAVEATREILGDQFDAAAQVIRQELDHQNIQHLVPKQLDIKLATRLLGAIMLAHKGALESLPQDRDVSLWEILNAAHAKFSAYFDLRLFEEYQSPVEQAYPYLQQVRYSNATPDILNELYTRAFPRAIRKSEGRFATPLHLTTRILQNIPIEFIPPSERLIADIACGWGSFLVSGYERLRRMSDMEESGRALSEHLYGNDKDDFTGDLAKLALLLTASSDHWQVENYDALTSKKRHRIKPTIMVGNPPFKGDRKQKQITSESDDLERTRTQEADKFLEVAIDQLQPGGYLAMIMPQNFGVSQASPETRRHLLENCDIQDLWEFPTEVFKEEATVTSVVLFAQKRELNHRAFSGLPVRTRMLQNREVDDFKVGGDFTASALALNQSAWNLESRPSKHSKTTHQMNYYFILSEKEWSEVHRSSIPCSRLATIFLGIIKGTKPLRPDFPEPKVVNWLDSADDVMEFWIDYSNKTITYPNELQRPRLKNRKLLEDPKVLMVALPNTSWGKRAKVAIERKGYFASENFWVFVPKNDSVSLEVLAAVLSWDVSNAWIIEGLKAPKIRKQTLESIPFPHLTPNDSQRLTNAVKQIEDAIQKGKDTTRYHRLMDELLLHAYGLSELQFRRLRSVMEWDKRTQKIIAHKRPSPEGLFRVTGQVDQVNADQGHITLWFDGIPGTHTVPIVDSMPGWMLRAGSAFRAEVSYEALRHENWRQLKWWNIRPKEYNYLAEDEVLLRLTEELAIA
ncbi:MAG: SAM-dependent DNA methyltransferase [Chloroflexi bacterium]|nr:SAM-dependent DNA methyltransferase [Chloroflexota bacterium]